MRHGINYVLCGNVQTSSNASVVPSLNIDPGDFQAVVAASRSLLDQDSVRSSWSQSRRGCDALVKNNYSKYNQELDIAAANNISLGSDFIFIYAGMLASLKFLKIPNTFTCPKIPDHGAQRPLYV